MRPLPEAQFTESKRRLLRKKFGGSVEVMV